jgi:tetratricopeptide (TPR) repeat protein
MIGDLWGDEWTSAFSPSCALCGPARRKVAAARHDRVLSTNGCWFNEDEMPRFESLGYSLSDARTVLRNRFSRYLQAPQPFVPQVGGSPPLTDESVLALLLDLTIAFGTDESTARVTYENARVEHPSAPEFDELSSIGWIRLIWGRVSAALHTHSDVRRTSEETRATVDAVLNQRFVRTFSVGSSASQIPALHETIAAMSTAPRDVHHLACPSPAWVVARIWERLPTEIQSTIRLKLWNDRCDLLRYTCLAPSRTWPPRAADEFRNAAFQVLRSEGGLLDWEDLRKRLIARIMLMSTLPTADCEERVGVLPPTLVERFVWLHKPGLEQVRDDHDTCGELWRLVGYLLRDVEETDRSAVPHPVMQALLDIAYDRPELLDYLTYGLSKAPALFADLLLDIRFSALACLLIVRPWSLSGAANYDTESSDTRAARLLAFTDAIATLGHFASNGLVDASEIAALLSWLSAQAVRSPVVNQESAFDEQVFAVVRTELVRLPSEFLGSVFNSCVGSIRSVAHETPEFAAALEVLSLGDLANVVDPHPLVNSYVKAIRECKPFLSEGRLTTSGAWALVQLAARSGPQCWQEFLMPLDVIAASTAEGDANPYTVLNGVVRSVRTHVRVLCRAVAGSDEAPSPELLEGLVRWVRCGALAHAEKGRVPAFSIKYETARYGSRKGRSIAVDLGEALNALQEGDRERLLRAILETDEPAMLAELVAFAPKSYREQILDRINELTPAESGQLDALDELQTRIEKLLAVGALEAAQRFLDVERTTKTLGKVPGRELVRLRAEMLLKLSKQDYDGLFNAVPPDDIDQGEQEEARDTIDFYKALANLNRPDGDLDAAEQVFQRLMKRRPDIAAYAVNLLAVRVSRLLAGNLFGKLRGENARLARTIANEEREADLNRFAGDDSRTIHDCNLALLLLATGQPERAYNLLECTPATAVQDRVAAFSAVALTRMGRNAEAIAAVETAIRVHGQTEVLGSAQAQILRGTPFDARAVATAQEDSLERVKSALFDFVQLDPLRQAAILNGPPDALFTTLVEHVRAAAAGVVELVPMMRSVKLDSCEDDLTAIVKTILSARLEFLHWSVSDQPKGGFTALGNPGERDLVLRKGSTTLCAVEAVVCRYPVTQKRMRDDLKSHFQKLLGYANCALFFYLAYSYVDEPGTVLGELNRIASGDAPFGFVFEQATQIPLTDSRPPGFLASYKTSLGDIKVAFLLMDMQQAAQRGAAKVAAASNPRR